ncbi:MAG: hypothetical protein IKQ10_09105, partial [Oscillospiraceae bacterium]|nr:hypothetical protein [Oscillospiraceae bacterium]
SFFWAFQKKDTQRKMRITSDNHRQSELNGTTPVTEKWHYVEQTPTMELNGAAPVTEKVHYLGIPPTMELNGAIPVTEKSTHPGQRKKANHPQVSTTAGTKARTPGKTNNRAVLQQPCCH